MNLSEAANRVNGAFSGKDALFCGVSIDSRTIQSGNLFVAITGEQFDGHDFLSSVLEKEAAGAVVEHEIDNADLPQIRVNNSLQALSNLAKHWRKRFDIPVIAITGSNGKTTVKEMVGSILGLNAKVLKTKGNLNNHIGVPLTLFDLDSDHRYAVVEMGANHAGEIAELCDLASPTIALITQCAPAHLEGFISEQGVARAKSEIFSGLISSGTAIINADDKYAKLWTETAREFNRLYFGIQNNADIYAKNIHLNIETMDTEYEMHFPDADIIVNLPLTGNHNVQNSLAAAACCYAVGIPVQQIKQGLELMQRIPGRMERMQGLRGSTIYNDTYNANPSSLEAGLKVLSEINGPRWLVFGDMGELGDMSEKFHKLAGNLARKHKIERLFTVGELSRIACAEFGNGGEHFDTAEELLSKVKDIISGDVTLLIKGSRFMRMEQILEGLRVDN